MFPWIPRGIGFFYQHGLEVPGATAPFVPGRVETGRWYDIRIELKDATVKCYLDGKLVQEAACKPTRALYAAAGRDTKTGEIVLAAVNSGSTALATQIKLAGAKNVGRSGTAIVLSSASPGDENSLEQPENVAPRKQTVEVGKAQFNHLLPPWSLNLLRIPVENDLALNVFWRIFCAIWRCFVGRSS